MLFCYCTKCNDFIFWKDCEFDKFVVWFQGFVEIVTSRKENCVKFDLWKLKLILFRKGNLCWRFYILVKNCDEYEDFMG